MTPDTLESQEGPCGCCWQHTALNDDTWTCQKTQQRWAVVFEGEEQAASHPPHLCQGNCAEHPLLNGYMLDWERATWSCTKTWADLCMEDEEAVLAAETWEQRAARQNRQAAASAARVLDGEAIKRQVYARDVEFRTKLGLRKGQQVKKRMQPCKWCIGQFKGDECWAHEYTDPKTGKRETPRTCDRIHPGEAGWCDEWFTNPRFNPTASPVENRFGCLKSAPKKPVAQVSQPESQQLWVVPTCQIQDRYFLDLQAAEAEEARLNGATRAAAPPPPPARKRK